MNPINTTRNAASCIKLLCARTSARTFTSNRVLLQREERPSPYFKKLKEAQKRFQKDDGVPVYLKAGTRDKILYQISLISTILGVGFSIHTFIYLAFLKK